MNISSNKFFFEIKLFYKSRFNTNTKFLVFKTQSAISSYIFHKLQMHKYKNWILVSQNKLLKYK